MSANPQSNWLNTLAVRASYIFTYFEAIFLEKNRRKTGMGGLSPPGKNRNRNRFVFLSFGVDPLNWQSFIEIGEIACSTTARCSRGHATNLLRDSCGTVSRNYWKKGNIYFLNANISNAQHYTQTNIP